MTTTRTSGTVTTTSSARPQQVTVYHGTVEVHTPAPAGAAHVTRLECDHLHTSWTAAEKCAAQLAAAARNYPERHRIPITDDETHRACPACPGSVFDASTHKAGCSWLADIRR